MKRTKSLASLRGLLLCCLLALLPYMASAQGAPDYVAHPDYAVQQWTVRDGLPNNTINDLVLASDGYLWLATNEGLVRFDGAHFTVFNSTNTPQLPSNRFKSLAEEPAGYLWIISEQGDLVLYHEGQFTGFDEKATTNPIRHRSPVSADGVADTVLIGMEAGIVRYTAGRLEPYRRDVIAAEVTVMERDVDGRLWVYALGSGIHSFEADGTVRQISLPDSLMNSRYVRLLADRADRMWAQVYSRIFRIDGDQVERILDSYDSSLEYADAEGGIWISSPSEGWWHHNSSGVSTLYPKSNDLLHAEIIVAGPDRQRWRTESWSNRGRSYPIADRILSLDEEKVFRLKDRFTEPVFDSHGNLWLGTYFHGLFQIKRSSLQTISEADGLPEKAVYPILEDREGSIWIGTFRKGLVRFDAAMNPTVFEPTDGYPAFLLSLYEDHTGTLWAGPCRMREYHCEPVGLTVQTVVRAMHEDRQLRFWVGTETGLFVGRSADETPNWSLVDSSTVRVITETRDGTLFFGTNGDGLLRYDEDGTIETYTTEDGLPSALIRDLYEDADGYLWIALEDRGLCRLDRRNGTSLQDAELVCLDSSQGLYQSGLHRIIEDDQGRFWFNTNTGIFWVERRTLNDFFAGDISSVTSVSYTEADGMRNREGNGGMQPAGIKARDGRLWFPTQDGVVIIDPRDVSLTEAPPVVLETVQVGEELRRAEPSLTLHPEERDIAFRYTALEYNRPEDVRFQYRLEGYDEAWRDAGAERVAAYTNLSPGDYSFLVRAGLGGIWSDPASMEVTSTPFFWEATWFLVLMGLLFATVGPLFYVFRVRQLKAREAVLEQAVAERTEQLAEKATELQHANELKSRFLANLSHEFRTPLTLTFGPLDDIVHQRFASLEEAMPHVERARRNGGRLLRLIKQLLDLSRLDAGALMLYAHRHDLAAHLRQIVALFDSFAETRHIHFSTDIPDGIPFHVYDADKMEKVVVNLLSNAFKFTPTGGKVSLSLLNEADGTMCIVVADTGPGISETHLGHLFDRFYQVDSASTRSHEGTGIGLALVKELVELHEGSIEVESTVGFGTRFTVRLPRLEEEASAPNDELQVATSASPETDYTLAASVPAPAPAPEMPASVPEEATVVLVVDDNADMRAYIRAHLEDHFTVVEAENGRVGFDRAVELVPDLVLSDVMMPEMDGLETCAALKADVRTSHIPVVLLTAKAEVEHRIEGFESGADAYMPKPFNAEELQVRVRTLIAERQRLRTRFAGMTGEVAIENESALLPREAAFLAKVEEMIEIHLSDAHFGVDHLAEALSMSRRQLFRKLGALTEETPAALMRRRRLEQATVFLREGAMSVKEVAFEVGFTSHASFGRLFREVYGVPPSQYVESESKA